MSNDQKTPAGQGRLDGTVRPTHWMDERGFVVTDEWLQSDEATSDFRAAYVIPCRRIPSDAIRPLYPCKTCSATGEADDGDPCHDCGGSGGFVAVAA